MSKKIIGIAALALVLGTSAASARNELVLLTDNDLFNVATVAMEGNGNRLQIVQDNPTGGTSNTVRASVLGDNNGGPLGASFSPTALLPGLQPGTIFQSGFDNAVDLSVIGSSNLFAFSQTGSGNSISANISGFRNEASVLQVGVDNQASFTQSGIGNVVSIIQRSW